MQKALSQEYLSKTFICICLTMQLPKAVIKELTHKQKGKLGKEIAIGALQMTQHLFFIYFFTCNIFILDMQGKLFQNLLIQSKQLYTENKTSNVLLQQLTTQHPKQTGMRQCIFMQH